MPKPRTKRGAIREERKRKRQAVQEEDHHAKRRRAEDSHPDEQTYPNGADGDETYGDHNGEQADQVAHPGDAPEKEFFGMLSEEEQEYFRSADEQLDQAPSDPESRAVFVAGIFKEAEGKELKLASSQSCSRLMERLIQLSSVQQRKKLFEAFAGHFLSLVQHRFASHCCEALFLKAAPVVTTELAGHDTFVLDTSKGGSGEEPLASMEHLFLATLDELEGSLSYLITDRFASHTLRVLLLVLSGRPLDDAAFKTLLKSKKKENIKVTGADADAEQGLRAVPSSFTTAVQKIISDSIAGMDATSLRVLAKHPIGNPTLQLLLELDLTLTKDGGKGKAEPALLPHLLPGAPKSLADESSPASEFVNSMVYDLIGSRLLETLITHAPGKVFKALNQNIFLPRIQGYVRNDISSYPAIRVLNRLGKDDLVKAVAQIEPTVPQLVQKARYNVIRTLFERCVARGLNDEIKRLNKGLKQGCGSESADLVKTLCLIKDEEDEGEKKKKAEVSQLQRNEYAIQSHGAQLLTFLLSIPGPSKGVQESLLALSPAHLLQLATASFPTVTVLTTALSTPSPNNPAFHKALASKVILPNVSTLALSQNGHNLLTRLVEVPSKGKDRSVPFHMKEAVMNDIGNMEAKLRDEWMGRSVWRSWKGDMWKTKRGDWKAWMREVDIVEEKPAKSGSNAVEVQERKPKGGANGKSVAQEDAPEDKAAAEPEDEDAEFKVDIRELPEEKPKKEKKEKKEKRDKSEKKEKKEKKDKKDKKAKKANQDAEGDVEMED